MSNLKSLRKNYFVSFPIQGSILARCAGYWFFYNLFLWHVMFAYAVIGYQGELAFGGTPRTFWDLYADFTRQHYTMLVCSVAVLPVLLWDAMHMSHRIAGPLVRLKNDLNRLGRGEHVEPIRLRKEDLLQDEINSLPVSTFLTPELVQVPLEARTKRSVIESLIEVAGRTWQIWEPSAIFEAVQAREEILSTAFETGVAIPHPRTPLPNAAGEDLIAFGRTFSGIPFGGGKRSLTDLFFLVLCRDSRTHLLVLARLGRMLQLPGFLDRLRECEDSLSAWQTIRDADEQIGADSV